MQWAAFARLRQLGRHRGLALAAGSALAASAFAANSHCLSGAAAPQADKAAALSAASISEIMEELRLRLAPPMNTAFVFAKPHANTPAVLEVVKAKFGEKAINVLQEGVVTGEEIDSKGYIDQHYYAIAEKSTLTSGKDLPVNAEKFKSVFGEDWKTVVSEGRALNALEFKKKFAIYQAEGALDKAWDETNVEKKTRVKLGGGFYCGQIEVEGLKCARHKT